MKGQITHVSFCAPKIMTDKDFLFFATVVSPCTSNTLVMEDFPEINYKVMYGKNTFILKRKKYDKNEFTLTF